MTQQEVLSQLIAVLSELRGNAETRVTIIRGLLDNEDLSEDTLRRSVLLYEDAGSTMNAWLDAVKNEVLSGKIKDANQVDADFIKKGAQKAELFIAHADALILGEERSIDNIVKPISNLVTGLIDAGVKVWSRLREEKTVAKDRIVAQLDSLRWLKFNEVV